MSAAETQRTQRTAQRTAWESHGDTEGTENRKCSGTALRQAQARQVNANGRKMAACSRMMPLRKTGGQTRSARSPKPMAHGRLPAA